MSFSASVLAPAHLIVPTVTAPSFSSISSLSLFVQHSYQQISLEQRGAELETHVPAGEGFSRGQSPAKCAPVALLLTQHRHLVVELRHCITVSLVS